MKPICILPGDIADPSIIRDGDCFYLTCSSLRYHPGLLIYKSTDLRNWEPICYALKESIGDVWAPDLVKFKDKYYIYFPVLRPGQEVEINVVWSERIDGGWSEPAPVGIKSVIDPGFVTDGENCWLYFNSSLCAKLSDDCLHVVSPLKKMKEPWQYPSDWVTEGMFDESPKLFFKNGYYYIITAQGGTAGPPTSHMAACFRAKTPLGEWEVSPYNPIVHTYSADEPWWSIGHATYFEDKDENGYFIFHGYKNGNANMGRAALLCGAEWTPDGFPIAKELDWEDSSLPDFCDAFSSDSLDINWNFYNNYRPERIAFDNGLILQGAGETPWDSYPMTLNGRFESYDFSAEITDVSGVGAGISLFYNENAHLGIYAKDGGIYSVASKYCEKIADASSKTLYLKIEKRGQLARLCYSFDGKSYITCPKEYDVTNFQHNFHGGFLSLRPSVFSFGKGQAKFINVSLNKK